MIKKFEAWAVDHRSDNYMHFCEVGSSWSVRSCCGRISMQLLNVE